MCGRIILNKRIITPGQTIPVFVDKVKMFKTFGIWNGSSYSYNARSETWHQKWGSCDWNLCKVPVEGFVEGSKTFYGDFLLSGLYKGENVILLTQEANEIIKPWHHRMPIILNETKLAA